MHDPLLAIVSPLPPFHQRHLPYLLPSSPVSAAPGPVVLSQNTNRCNTVQYIVWQPMRPWRAAVRRACAPPAAALAGDRHVRRGPLRLGASVEVPDAGDEHAVDDLDDGGAVLSNDDVVVLRQGVRGRKGGRVVGGESSIDVGGGARVLRKGRQGARRWQTRDVGPGIKQQQQQVAATILAAPTLAAPTLAAPTLAAAEEQQSSSNSTTTGVLPCLDHGLAAGGGLQVKDIHPVVTLVVPVQEQRRHSGDWSACGAAFLTLMMHG